MIVRVSPGEGARFGANWVALNLRTRQSLLVKTVNGDELGLVAIDGPFVYDNKVGDRLIPIAKAFEDGAADSEPRVWPATIEELI